MVFTVLTILGSVCLGLATSNAWLGGASFFFSVGFGLLFSDVLSAICVALLALVNKK